MSDGGGGGGRADGRVRVAVRLRPVLPNEEALVVDTAPVIEVESEVREGCGCEGVG